MSTIIDELVVRLGLDASSLDAKGKGADKTLKGLGKSSKETEGSVKKLGETSKKAASGVDSLAGSLGKFLALLGGTYALKAFIEDTIASSAALERLSRNLNVSAGQITAWGNVVEQGGGSAKGLQSTLMMLSKEQTNLAITGNSSLIPMFNMLGIAMVDAQGHALKSTEVLKQLASATEGKDRRTMFNLLTSNGIDEGTANALLRGRKELELNLAAQKNYAEQINKFAPVAEQMQRSLIKIKQNFTLLGLELLQKASPAIEKVINVLSGLSDWVQTHGQFIGDLAKILGAVAAGLTLVAIASSPITLTVAAVMLLAGAIALLWEDYQKWKAGGDALIDWEKWKPGIDSAIAGLKELRNVLGDIASAIGIVNRALHGDTGGANAASAKLHDKMMGHLGFRAGASPIADSFRNLFRSKDDQINILAPTGPGRATQKGDTVTSAYAMQYFKDRGFSRQESAALASQINSESSGNSQAPGDNGAAFGLLQWHKDRQDNFRKFAGRDIQGSSVDQQLAFIVHELNSGTERAAGRRLAGETDARQAGADASRYYVRPADADGEATKRGAYAAQLFGLPGASSNVQTASGAGGSAGSPADNSTTIHIDQATINTKATDATSMFQDVKSFSYGFTAQANGGLR